MGKKCNCCGQVIGVVSTSGIHEDCLSIKKEWGYFSSKDLTEHKFNICESCYDKWIETFKIPVEEHESHDVFQLLPF
ncbi:MAG: hypothetical protein ATN34_03320 [Epulopiscium sp. Nele67-Bin002]|nr:MAG: hypothetical protein BEN18_11070 [Epulopiscium sp. Nuni2H_MBin001]OON91757.1 MAG: hypothetical protein ATN34_03320 [Epulopiscium sp. Nele67-Bin002]OON93204.1 MAG: hypothetical protein ATN33_00550 [Epulopiscium sp. Nele67-Bin001]